jgi:hypothetical protein
MTTYLDEPHAKVWADTSVPCVFTSIKKTLSLSEFENVARKQLSCVIELNKSKKEVFSVTDFSELRGMRREEAISYMTKVVEREFRLGVSRKFFIRSHDKTTRDSLIHGLVAASSLNFYVYDTFAEVLKEINSVRSAENSATEKKASRSFFIVPKFLKHFFALRYPVKV